MSSRILQFTRHRVEIWRRRAVKKAESLRRVIKNLALDDANNTVS
jgi:hypothetical protein